MGLNNDEVEATFKERGQVEKNRVGSCDATSVTFR